MNNNYPIEELTRIVELTKQTPIDEHAIREAADRAIGSLKNKNKNLLTSNNR